MRYVEPPTNSALYQRYHKAIRQKYGQPWDYYCVRECSRIAHDWAWVHDTDPSDPDNYMTLCRKCHKEYDRPEYLKRERARKKAEGIRKGWTPERRAAQSARAKEQWQNGNLSKEETSRRARRDRPWLSRRVKNGVGVRVGEEENDIR